MREELQDRDSLYCAQLSALGYPGFAHIDASVAVPDAGAFLLDALSQSTLDARVAESLPWLAGRYSSDVDWRWLVSEARLRGIQNRVGFLIEVALNLDSGSSGNAFMGDALRELEEIRLPGETTFCWESMPAPAREWMRRNRSPEAARWNVVTRMGAGGLSHGDHATKTSAG